MPTVLFGFDDEVLIKSSDIATSLRRMILRCETEYPGPLRKWRRDYETKHPPPSNASPKMALRVKLPFSDEHTTTSSYSSRGGGDVSSSTSFSGMDNNKKPVTRVFVSPVAQQDVWESTITDLSSGGNLVVAEVVFVVWNEVLEDLQAISTNQREFVPSSALLHEMNADKIASTKNVEHQKQNRREEEVDDTVEDKYTTERSTTTRNTRKHAVHHQQDTSISSPPPQSIPRLAIPSTTSTSASKRSFGGGTQESSWLKNRSVDQQQQAADEEDSYDYNRRNPSNNNVDPNNNNSSRRSSIVSRLRNMEDNNISVQLDDVSTTTSAIQHHHQVSSIIKQDDDGESGSFLKRDDDEDIINVKYDRNEVPLYTIPVPTHVIVAVGITLNPPVVTLLFQNPPKDVLSAGDEERSLFTEEDMRLLERNILDRCVPGHQVFSGGMRAARQLQQQQHQSAAGVNTSNSPSRNPFRFVRVHREDTTQAEARTVFGNFKTIRQRQQASQQALRVASQEHWEMHLQQLHFNDVQEALLYCAIADTMEVLGANRLVPHDGSSVLNNTLHAQGVDSRMAMLRGSMASTTANAQYIGGSGVGGGGNVDMKTHCQIFFFFPIVGHS